MPSQFMVDIEGTELSPIEQEIIKNPKVGAILLFTRNFNNPGQLAQLVNDIRTTNPTLFIAIDQEGGNVQRFQRQGFSSIPAARSYGRIFDKNPEVGAAQAQEYGALMANDLLAHNIDLSLAPILDLHGQSSVIGGLDRAFHTNPTAVAVLAGAFIKGMKIAGMPVVGKHFPGHGSVVSDSHRTMPVCSASREELEASDLKPFIELINQGLLDAVMPAHVTYTAIDKKNAAGFSSQWLQEILRAQLGFHGMVLSDCLSMKGADIGNLMVRAKKALQAGCDMLIVCNQPRNLLVELLENIQEEQSAESLMRIITFKNKMSQKTSRNGDLKAAASTIIFSQNDELNRTFSV